MQEQTAVMDERPIKPRGPITLLLKSQPFRWAVSALFAIALLYVVSFGPVYWIGSRAGFGSEVASVVVQPLLRLYMHKSDSAEVA